MLIVLEGPDNSGKTWLATRLAEASDGEIRHWSQIKHHPLEEYELPLQDYVPGSGRTVICDRLHLGEMVYGPLYRGESRLDPVSWAHIEAFLNSRGAVLVHLSESLRILEQRHAAEGETFLQVEDLPRALEMYEQAVGRTTIDRVFHDARSTDRGLPGSILDAAAFEERQVEATYTLTEGRYIGSTIPTLLLVGEQRNLDDRGFTSPFVPMPATSGHYLLNALHDAGTVLRGIGLINAVEDEKNLVELWDLLQRPPIVTLGATAHQIVSDLELDHGAVPHPQYIRRFFNRNSAWYAKTIRQAWNHQTNLTQERP